MVAKKSEAAPQNPDTVVFLGMGGTIAGTAPQADDLLNYTAGQLPLQALLDGVPPLRERLAGWQVVAEPVSNIDSKDLDVAHWQALLARCAQALAQPAVRAIVITHGTDTLEETAWLLHGVLAPQKPVVLTCAMRPATALAPDGPQNLLDATTVALDGAAAGRGGVWAVCAGRIHSARWVQKIHPHRLDAFDSGDAGPLGTVQAGAVQWFFDGSKTALRHDFPQDVAIKNIVNMPADRWPQVHIITSHAAANARVAAAMVQAAVQAGVQALVVAGTGNGTVHHALQAALLQARQQGVRVVRSTRCLQGQVQPTASAVLPETSPLSPVKARISLMLELLMVAGGPVNAID